MRAMASARPITVGLDRYDRHLPLFLGTVPLPNGLRLDVREVGMVPPRRHGIERHRRMLVDAEFDLCEVSLASYILARRAGAPISAIPVFPRRLFSQNHLFVNAAAGLRTPADLAGCRVGVWAFQVTMSVLAKGDLQRDYGVRWRDIRWVTQHAEEIDWSAVGLPIERAPSGADIGAMLAAGELDALVHPHPPAIVQTSDRVRRLFDDPVGECERYFDRHGYVPIMHLVAIRDDVARAHPELPRQFMAIWEASKQQAHDLYHDPGYALLAFARNEYERQARRLGADCWPSGLAANRTNLEHFMSWMVDQRLLDAPLAIDTLFHPSVIDT
jgi:4,5-dihydroxyphthalate decarboxylase